MSEVLNRILARLEECSHLQLDWDSCGGAPVSLVSLEKAREYAEHCVAVFWAPGGFYPNTWKKVSTGESFETLTLNPSIDCTRGGGCKFHGWVKDGQVTW